MRILKALLTITIFCILTVLTQVGGVVYVVSLVVQNQLKKWIKDKNLQRFLRLSSFLALYCLATFIIVPPIAKRFGRVQLPLSETNHVQPLTFLTCLLNRNYVRPELRQTAFEVAKQMNNQFPGTTINYLEANFPFWDQFPLIPHLSHNDGKKLDLSFCYIDTKTGISTNKCPSFIGYGICERPLANEQNTTDICTNKGYWIYGYLSRVMSQTNQLNYTFDGEKTKELVNRFAIHPSIGKIFIEPHLKTRLQLTSDKIRFHGCQSVRHDDHIHVQLK